MTLIRRHPLWTLVAVGLAVRLGLAFALYGNYDITIWHQIDDALDRNPLTIYDVNRHVGDTVLFRWPYAPLYLAWIALASGLSDLTGLHFHGTVQVLPILADVAIAIAIYVYLGWRGGTERVRLAGAALVLLGPCFIAISGYHGQFDQVAILPAVVALMVWERTDVRGRALRSGLLIGIGAALKTVPLLVALPLLASSRSRGDAARLLAVAVAVPLLMLVPFFVTDPSAVLDLRRYQGLPGLGGLSLVSDPGSASAWMVGRPFDVSPGPLGSFVDDHSGAITLVALLALAVLLFRYRPAPVDGAVLLWLTLYAFSPNFFMHYLIWGLPFFIMAGYLREVALLQLALIPALIVYYLAPYPDATPAAAVYAPIMICLWAFWVAALITLATRIVRQRSAQPAGTRAPLVDLAAPAEGPGGEIGLARSR